MTVVEFFGLGTGEILLVIVIALIIFGPERIPEITRRLGRTMRVFRQAASGFTTAVTRELEEEGKSHAPQSMAGSDLKSKESANAKHPEPDSAEVASTKDQRDLNGKDE